MFSEELDAIFKKMQEQHYTVPEFNETKKFIKVLMKFFINKCDNIHDFLMTNEISEETFANFVKEFHE